MPDSPAGEANRERSAPGHICQWHPVKYVYLAGYARNESLPEQLGHTVVTLRCPYCLDLTERVLLGHVIQEVEAVPIDASAASPEAKVKIAFSQEAESLTMRCLRDWHSKFGVPIAGEPAAPAPERISLREDLIREEWEEFLEAGANRDPVAAADALADLVYVVYGAALEWGIPLDACFAEVHRSNMTKVWADGTVHYREDGKVLKPPTYSAADIAKVLNGPRCAGQKGTVDNDSLPVGEANRERSAARTFRFCTRVTVKRFSQRRTFVVIQGEAPRKGDLVTLDGQEWECVKSRPERLLAVFSPIEGTLKQTWPVPTDANAGSQAASPEAK